MKIKMNEAVKDGFLMTKYSAGAREIEMIEGVPYISFPFEVEGVNEKYLSWIMIDYDSNPVVSFSWIHQLVANYEHSNGVVVENLVESKSSYIGGRNSFASPLANIQSLKVINNYGGPTPPDKDHKYTLIVYAHDQKLNLDEGFYLNELYDELKKVKASKTEIEFMAKSIINN